MGRVCVGGGGWGGGGAGKGEGGGMSRLSCRLSQAK